MALVVMAFSIHPAIGQALSELITYGEFKTLDLGAFGWSRVIHNRPYFEANII